jgi:hypothetical protein
VKNISIGGLSIETPVKAPVGLQAHIDFLVQEGQIRIDAVVCHAMPQTGVGLKFRAISESDRRNLAVLMMRLRSLRK